MQRSEKAKWHMRKRGTVSLVRLPKNRKMFSVMKESHYNCSFVQRNQSKETVKRKKIRKEDKEGKPKVTKKKGRKQMFREGRTR